MIAIIDYGAGNIKSLQSALSRLKLDSRLTHDPQEILASDAIILPGVGAFHDAMTALHDLQLTDILHTAVNSGKPLLGICLGMQLLYENSLEDGNWKGLGLLPGTIKYISGDVKVPHMGWNTLTHHQENPLLNGVPDDAYVYFVHSYFADSRDDSILLSSCSYGAEIPAIVQKGNIFGMQFHPEKSSSAGMKLLQNFGELMK